MSEQLATLQKDIAVKFGDNAFKFSTTPVGDHVVEAPKESVIALLRYLKEYAG